MQLGVVKRRMGVFNPLVVPRGTTLASARKLRCVFGDYVAETEVQCELLAALSGSGAS